MASSLPRRSELCGAPEVPVLDADHLENLVMLAEGEPGFLKAVFSVFLTTTPKALAEMGAHAEGADYQNLAKQAHTLKGSCLTLGAPGFVKACKDLEDAAKSGQLDRCLALIEALALEFEAIQAALGEFKGGG